MIEINFGLSYFRLYIKIYSDNAIPTKIAKKLWEQINIEICQTKYNTKIKIILNNNQLK